MTFEELKNTDEYLMADTISFVDTNGVELDVDNLEDERLNDIWVVDTRFSNGHLEIMLN